MITVKEKIPSTQAELDSVNQNDRPILSEELHKNRIYKTKRRAMYNSESKDFELIAEEF